MPTFPPYMHTSCITKNYFFHGHFLFPLVLSDILWISCCTLPALRESPSSSQYLFVIGWRDSSSCFSVIVFLAGCHAGHCSSIRCPCICSLSVDCIAQPHNHYYSYPSQSAPAHTLPALAVTSSSVKMI